MRDLRAAVRGAMRLASAGCLASVAFWMGVPSSTESAVANGDTRTLHLYHTHTGETIDATYRVDGHYDPSVLAQLNHFLRDWRNNEEHVMDPRLFDAVWEAYRTAGATDRIQIYSAYRSPETNAMLRRRSRAVAEHSQHMLGKAMDTTMPGFPMSRVREAGMRLQHGGVGWYPSANFVHLDVGGVRSWPRMSYDQLARLFPDGKTVHIAADGRTLPGYEQARIDLADRGVTELPPAQESQGFFAWLFGNGSGGSAQHEDEEDRRAPVAVASAAPQPEAARPAATAPALAYAAPSEAAPSEAPPQTADTRGLANGQQVASLELQPVSLTDAVPMPLPPRRPAELSADLDVPLPPARPGSLDQAAPLQVAEAPIPPSRPLSFAALGASSAPVLRGSRLPALITNGRDAGIRPHEALAFASEESIPTLRAVPLPVARPFNLIKPLALRSAGAHRVAAPLAVAAIEPMPAIGLAGPQLTGLRSAAQRMSQQAP